MRLLSTLCIVSTVVASCAPSIIPRSAAAQSTTPSAQISPAQSTASRKSFMLEITNTAGLVMVREKGGAYRFAQVITTPDLWIDMEKPKGARVITLTLRDANGKRLWETRLGDGGPGQLDFEGSRSSNPGSVTSIGVVPTETSPTGDSLGVKAHLVIGGDNILWLADFKASDGSGAHAERRGDIVVMSRYEDGKLSEVGRGTIGTDKTEFSFSSNADKKKSGAFTGEASAEITDKAGTVKTSTETRDGKTYMVLTIGSRRILIEGKEHRLKTGEDGEIIVERNPVPK